jgi:hypothetical protein
LTEYFLSSTERIGEHYTRNQELDEDHLLDTLTVLELNCGLARDCLKSAWTGFERIFSYFFPRTELPSKFDQLARQFNEQNDPALAHR